MTNIRTCTRLHRVASCIGAATVLLGVVAATGTASALPGRDRHPTLNTHKSWDGSAYVYPFGCPDTATYGQVVTVPDGMTRLTRFNFYLTDAGVDGSMVLRGEVYRWDGTKATGEALWESHPRTVSYDDASFHRKQFRPHGVVELQPGAQYVIFASISKDYEQCPGSYTLNWGLTDDSYSGGGFVYLNDSGDESQWTSTAWSTFGGEDLAFKAWLS